jgi:hypothetical protein
MAEQQQVVRGVAWDELFSFPQIFKSWRMAIHPSKLVLCTAALLVMFFSGWVLDTVWSSWGGYAYPGEISDHAVRPAVYAQRLERFQDEQAMRRQGANLLAQEQNEYMSLGIYRAKITGVAGGRQEFITAFDEALKKRNEGEDKNFTAATAAKLLEDEDESLYDFLSEASEQAGDTSEKIYGVLETAYEDAEGKIENNNNLTDEQEEQALEDLDRHYQLALRGLSEWKRDRAAERANLRGEGISEAFLDFQWNCLRSAVASVCYGNFTGGLKDYLPVMAARRPAPVADADPWAPPAPNDDPPGMFFWLLMAWRGVAWLFLTHWVYAVVYGVIALASVALFGGAVHRIAALHFAREEKISILQALRFSAGKFFSFFTAPLIPIGLIVLLGALVFAGALLLNLWVVGEIIVGALFFLALVLGLAMAFLTIGFVGGGWLMYPTVAVEGSDSFHGISNSFSFVFGHPWRTIFYVLVAAVYGALTYLFVRLFAFLALKAVHLAASVGVFVGGDRLGPDADKLDVLWTSPTFGQLFGPVSWDAMSGGQAIGGWLINAWVFLVATVVLAYLLSFAASASTVIYFLLRRREDATDLDDVFVEEPEEEPLPEAPAETPAESAPAGGEAAPAPEPPAASGEQPGMDTGDTSTETGEGEDGGEKPNA